MDSREALLALNLIEGVGPVRVRQLLDHFGEAPAILGASQGQLQNVRGIGEETAAAIAEIVSDYPEVPLVLDPVLATRRVITLEPDQTATIDIVYGMADTREACVALVRKYDDRRLADRVFELSWTHSQVVMRQINASEADTQLYARLAGATVRLGTQYAGSEADGDLTRVEFVSEQRSTTVRARFLFAADGAVSRVAPDLGLDENREWILGVEDVYTVEVGFSINASLLRGRGIDGGEPGPGGGGGRSRPRGQ